MTLDEQRRNGARCYEEAIAAIRATAWAECGGPPLSPREIERALQRAAERRQ